MLDKINAVCVQMPFQAGDLILNYCLEMASYHPYYTYHLALFKTPLLLCNAGCHQQWSCHEISLMYWPLPVTISVLKITSRALILSCAEPSGGKAALQSLGWEEEFTLWFLRSRIWGCAFGTIWLP